MTSELESIWATPLKTLSGTPVTLSEFKGKALLVVNVASQCGNTPQYAALEALQKKYGPKQFTVIGFPCNQFGGQEPGSAEEIQTFWKAKPVGRAACVYVVAAADKGPMPFALTAATTTP